MISVAARRQASAVLLVAGMALLFDALDESRPFQVITTGLLDEPAHLALTALLLLVIAPWLPLGRGFVVAALIASVAIDLDHVPLYLGATGISARPGGRPYSHSLLTVLVVLIIALLARRWRTCAIGVSIGLVSHLARDICEGVPGVSLFWPVNGHEYLGSQADFQMLVGVLGAMSLLGVLRSEALRRRPAPGAGRRELREGSCRSATFRG